MTEQFRPRGFSLLPTIVKNLLIINVLVFLAQELLRRKFGINLDDSLGLHYIGASDFRPWQLITYMFLHGSIGHIFFNMFALWMFGYALENVWGPKRFLSFYLITGVGAGLTQFVMNYFQLHPEISAINAVISDPSGAAILDYFQSHALQIYQDSGSIANEAHKLNDALRTLSNDGTNKEAIVKSVNFLVDYKEYLLNLPTVIGASGAVFGILLAFGMMFPNMLIYIYFLFPVKAKYFVIFYGLLELYLGISGREANIAHFAHLGGMIFGFIMIYYWKKRGRLY
jgi:membrane associated rhomboid family serine protease